VITNSVSSSSCYFVKKEKEEEEEEEGERKITHPWMNCSFSVRFLKFFHLSSGLSPSLSLLPPPRSFPDSRATSLSLFLFSLVFPFGFTGFWQVGDQNSNAESLPVFGETD
jgi:hypothetical protein